MQKKLLGIALVGFIGMSYSAVHASEAGSPKKKVKELLGLHKARNSEKDIASSDVRDLSHDVVNYVDEAGKPVQKDLFEVLGNVYHHLHDFKDRFTASKTDDELSCAEKFYGFVTASAMLTYGMRYAQVATQGWRAAAALGGNLTGSLGATPVISSGLKWAAGIGGAGATKVATLATPWAGCIAGVLLIGKSLYDCKDLASKDKFNDCKAVCQARLDLEKKAYMKAHKAEAKKMKPEDLAAAKAKLNEAYSITDAGVKWHMLGHALYNNISAIGDASFKLSVVAGAVILLGMLAQQNK